MTRPILRIPVGFAPTVVDKVERLLEILSALREDPHLRDAFVLHGGTALNLFHDDAPRLSVDIDLMFIGAEDVDAMRSARPEIDRRIRRLLESIGYVVQGTNGEHSGQTYRIKYPGDYVKLDLTYLARVPMLLPEMRPCLLAEPRIEFPVTQESELIAGKVKAMMERLTARDLFDLYRLAGRRPDAFGEPLTRALTIRAISTADPFPFSVDPVVALERFRVASDDFSRPLTAMLRPEDMADFDEMIASIARWLAPLSMLMDDEAEYVRRLDEEAVYSPELLVGAWPDVLDRARRDPVMAWKVKNLAVRLAGGGV